MVNHKIWATTPNEICEQCNQCYEGDCVAFNVPHSNIEQEARVKGNFGMECDSEEIKERYYSRYGMKYRTPKGKYDS